MKQKRKMVAVIGSGSFGTSVAQLLAKNVDVLLYTRNQPIARQINEDHFHFDVTLNSRIKATTSIKEVINYCRIIFPIVPSSKFRLMIREFAPYLKPYHILIHGTKGLDIDDLSIKELSSRQITRKDVFAMSEVIRSETSVARIGCIAGPNLAREILDGQPTACVLASEFDEVIKAGQDLLSSEQFFVFGSHDMIGAELAGALKNIIALGSGILGGMGFGKNMQSVLIVRGLSEMIYFGMAMGTTVKAFLGTAGIGDLIATATSEDSRNYTFGKRIGQGEKYSEILQTTDELAEGVRTLQIINPLLEYYHIVAPITQMLYRVVFEGLDMKKAIGFLMKIPYQEDVDYL